jgi:hypothetical protein
MTVWLTILPLAYLLGSIPFGYLLVRIFRKQDIRATGSGNIGATNVARSGAKGLGILTLLLDLGKGLAAVLLAFLVAAHSILPSWLRLQLSSATSSLSGSASKAAKESPPRWASSSAWYRWPRSPFSESSSSSCCSPAMSRLAPSSPRLPSRSSASC